ncbi:WD-40 repeat-containing protein [Reticulomyxa filosa]|uniref:WD-40 repeat-containing protein n=1 Tax=Reticulomyxa filosa TaxID=46433 RepID=X6P161_RETFI|nr:WD-40 repeat-containing protein [Reticulomyxa filosa]|eukprot:ETO31961.1 WD-40 repeat-containing protein [Reticulomyxa filosa]
MFAFKKQRRTYDLIDAEILCESIKNIYFMTRKYDYPEKIFVQMEKQCSTQSIFIFRKLLVLFYLLCMKQLEEDVKIIIQHWTRMLKIKLGWINDFDKIIINYTISIFILDIFRLSSKLLKTFSGHTNFVWSIDYSNFDCNQVIYSGSEDKTVGIWYVDTNKQIQSFNEHSGSVYCVKYSQYYYHNYHYNVICSSSEDKTICFWNLKHNQRLKIFNEHDMSVNCIEFSPFNGGRYLCSGSTDKTIRLWDVETSKSLHVFDGHTRTVWCVDFSSFQNNDNNKSNIIGMIGGNGYTICSGAFDKTIRIWDIETAKQLNVFKGHEHWVRSVKYGSNELVNIILSGSDDISVRLWDIRSGQQIQMFNGHTNYVSSVEYSPFVVKNTEVGGNSNVICSGSLDNTIRFWDIRSNKNELYAINGNNGDEGIICLKFVSLKIKGNNNEKKSNNHCGVKMNTTIIILLFCFFSDTNLKQYTPFSLLITYNSYLNEYPTVFFPFK